MFFTSAFPYLQSTKPFDFLFQLLGPSLNSLTRSNASACFLLQYSKFITESIRFRIKQLSLCLLNLISSISKALPLFPPHQQITVFYSLYSLRVSHFLSLTLQAKSLRRELPMTRSGNIRNGKYMGEDKRRYHTIDEYITI